MRSIRKDLLATHLLALVMATGLATPASAQRNRPARRTPPPVMVSADWVEEHMFDDDVIVVQAEMRRDRYEEGHLAGAWFLDMNRLVWEGDPAWGTEMRPFEDVVAALQAAGVRLSANHVVVYSSNPLFAARAFVTLEHHGFPGKVRMLDGGLGVWVRDGRPLSTDEPLPRADELLMGPPSTQVLSADWIRDRLGSGTIALIDARPDDEYTGAAGGMGGSIASGHIPGATQMYWEDLIESRDVPLLRDRAEVEALFRAAVPDRHDAVVVYCMVGWRASFTYVVARMLGYHTLFYDGSWHEWGSREDLPKATGRAPR